MRLLERMIGSDRIGLEDGELGLTDPEPQVPLALRSFSSLFFVFNNFAC